MWQFVGALLAFFALVVGVIAILTQLKRKQLSYEIVNNIPLLTLEEEISGKLQVLYEEEVVKDVRLFRIRIVNSGRVPIIPSDYIEPIVIDFGAEARLLSVDVFQKNPPNLHGTFTRQGGKVTFTPVLLNGGDFFSIKLLVTHFRDTPTVDGRIVDVKAIHRLKQKSTNLWLAAIGFLLATAGLFLDLRIDRPHRTLKPQEVWYLGLTGLGYVLIATAIWRRGTFKRLMWLLSRPG